MNIIHTLPPHIANLIAAGEVVERPASIVKELLENAVDAGAENIGVEIENGGIASVTVTDDGCGMTREDARVCFLRHATSKIRTKEDLYSILTLGFRGEALAAISAVSKVDLYTRRAEDLAGTHIYCEAGNIVTCEDAGCPVGTSITVREVFYNTPARMKFLKKNATEGGYCAAAVDYVALSHPEIAFRFTREGRVTMRTPGDGQPLSAIHGVCGRDFVDSLIPIPPEETDGTLNSRIQIWGYVTKPERALSGRNSQYFFLNGRHIHSRTLTAALEEAYRTSIMVGKYPGCVIYAAVDPAHVDVNVHPAKLEVKFSDEREAFQALYAAVKRAFAASERPQYPLQDEKEPEKEETPPQDEPDEEDTMQEAPAEEDAARETPQAESAEEEQETEQVIYAAPKDKGENMLGDGTVLAYTQTHRFAPSIDISAEDFTLDFGALTPTPAVQEPEPEPETAEEAPREIAEEAPVYRILGEAFKCYIIVELEDKLMYIDKHAAHERILYNKLKSAEEPAPGQNLLTPVVLPTAREDRIMLDENEAELARLGLEYTDFGDGNILIHSIPPHIDPEDAAAFIEEVCSRMKKGENDDRREDILHSIACKAAIKAGWTTQPEEIDALVRTLLADPELRYCPHGRPIALELSRRDFEKRFFRV